MYTLVSTSNLEVGHVKSIISKKFLIVMLALITVLLIDTSVVKINDLVNKFFIPIQSKLILFSVNSSACLILQYFIIKYVKYSFQRDRPTKILGIKSFYIISLASLAALVALMAVLIFEQFYYSYYDTWISISIISLSYGISATFIIWLSLLFLSWYRSNHSFIVLLYFVSMLGIGISLIMGAAFASAKVSDRPSPRGEYVGSSGELYGSHLLLQNISRITSLVSFFSIWLTTAILMNYYRERLINAILYWVILSIPLVYFLITYFYQFILANPLSTYLAADPVTVSIVLGVFFSLSKPIGGLVFGISFWRISRIVSYERNIRTYMIVSAWGIFLIFAANQAEAQIVGPYPPFGLATLTILNTGAFLIMIGIYNSARHVSANNELRRFIHKQAFESRLLSLIGHAEMENEIQRTVTKISRNIDTLEADKKIDFELDENELKKYVDLVIREVKHKDENIRRD